MISTVTLNPTVDKTVYVNKLVPNDTNRVIKAEIDAGGKGINCSRMLKRLGAETRAVTFLGGKTGDFVHCVLEREGIPVDFVPIKRPTRTCTAIEDSAGPAPTCFNERGGPFEKAKNAARESSFVVFGGSVPVGVNPDVYNVLVQIAGGGGAKAVLDADGEALAEGLKAKPYMIKPNREEAERVLGKQFDSKSDVARGALAFAEMGVELVLISLGKQGLIAYHEETIYDAVPPEVKVVSSVGSGDSLLAGVTCALEQGLGIEQALRLGCAAGATAPTSARSPKWTSSWPR